MGDCDLASIINEKINLNNNNIVKLIVINANEILTKYGADERIIPIAIDIAVRYIRKNLSLLQERKSEESIYITSYFISLRHPFSYPSNITRETFSRQFNIKETSLDYYVFKITSGLNFIRIHDDRSIPYYIDSTSLIHTALITIINSELSESLIKSIINNTEIKELSITERITEIIFDRLKILPEVFRYAINSYIINRIRDEINKSTKIILKKKR